MADATFTGKVVRVNRLGGVIEVEGSPETVIFTPDGVARGTSMPKAGQRVTFELVETKLGTRARNVAAARNGAPAATAAPAPRPQVGEDTGRNAAASSPVATAFGQGLEPLFAGARGVSPYQLGNALVRTPLFRSLVEKLHTEVERGKLTRETAFLGKEFAGAVAAGRPPREPELSRRIRSLETLLFPLCKIAVPGAPDSTRRAVVDVICRDARTALRGDDVPLRAPSDDETPEVAQATPRVAVELNAPAGGRVAPADLVEAIAGSRRAKFAVECGRGAELANGLNAALRSVLERPLDRSEQRSAKERLEELASWTTDAIAVLNTFAPEADDASPGVEGKLISRAAAALEGTPVKELAPALIDRLAFPDTLPRAVRELELARRLCASRAPDWARERWVGGSARVTPIGVATALGGAPGAFLDDLETFLDWEHELTEEKRQLLPTLTAGDAPTRSVADDVRERLHTVLERSREDAAFTARLTAIQELVGEVLRARLGKGRDPGSQDLLAMAETVIRRARALESHLSNAAFAQLEAEVLAWNGSADLEPRLEAIDRAAQAVGLDVSMYLPSLEKLLEVATRRSSPAAAGSARVAEPVVTETPVAVQLLHPLSRGRTAYAAELAWAQVPGKPFGTVAFPVRLKVETPSPQDGEWRIAVAGKLLENLDSTWLEQFPPSRTVRLPANRTHVDFAIRLPVSSGNADLIDSENRLVTLTLTATRGEARVSKSLEWKGLRRGLPIFESPFHTSITKKEMEQRPLGVERRFKALCQLVEGGRRSFRIHGPRRFGKTTLVRSLFEHFQGSKSVVVLERVVASDKESPAETWAEIGLRLEKRFDKPVKVTLGANQLPVPGTFEGVRARAHELGFKAVYVIVDEAQALFAKQPVPARYGTAVKTQLEGDWSAPAQGKLPLLFGFVGQAHLPKLMGPDLLGAIAEEFSATRIEPEELLPLLRTEVSAGLQSTAEAREVLAEQAGNFWILDRLLRRIVDVCQDDGRAWFVEADVREAIDRLVADDQDRTDVAIWTYVRDVLNDSDDKNEWKPSVTFPVALAWAYMSELAAEDPIDAIMEALQDWASEYSIVIPEPRVRRVFEELHEQQILRADHRFELPMLERLLLAKAKGRPFDDQAARQVLVRLGLPQVEVPPATEEGASGGQAEIVRARLGEKVVAVRRVSLQDLKAEIKFAREVSHLHRLNDASAELVQGAKLHLPHLDRAGAESGKPDTGVVVYDWVEGAPLEREATSGSGALTVLAGLGRALWLLREVPGGAIIHRDIKPDNVIVRGSTGEPVLVDFGVSITETDTPQTKDLAGVIEFLPPEVRNHGASAWRPEGDMYSLGVTIRACLEAKARTDEDLAPLVSAMTAERPQDRITPAALVERVDALLARRRIRELDERNAKEFADVVQRLPGYGQEAIAGAKGDYLSARRGVNRGKVRLRQAAEFVENLFAARVRNEYPEFAERIPKGTFLVQLNMLCTEANEQPPTDLAFFIGAEAQAVGLLRNAAVHPSDAQRIERNVQLTLGGAQRGGATAVTRAVIAVGREVGKLYGGIDLKGLLERWLEED